MTTAYISDTNKVRVPTGQGKLEKVREFEWSGKEGEGKIFFFGKVRENENLVPSDVRFLD